MTTLSKSPKAIALVAYGTAQRSLPAYSHLKSPKKFTQPQLVACLVLKEFFKTDYRGIMEILADSSDLREVLEMEEVPHYTTLQKAAHRFTKKRVITKLLQQSIAVAGEAKILPRTLALAAIDSTGFESHYTSTYFVSRKQRALHASGYQTTVYSRFPKVGIVVDTASLLVLSGIPSRGPSPDILHFRTALKAASHVCIRRIAADAGYDAEHAHAFAREELGMTSIIPNRIGRPTTKLPSGKYRREMALHFDTKRYGQRWMVETVNSIVKRLLGSFLRARTYWSQMREMMLRLFTYNVMVLRY
jgi:hypothetical protein